MSRRKYNDQTCTYCTVPGSSFTGDHVIARQFFPLDNRDNLPQVPACIPCNKTKSDLEHYLTTVLPFGYGHPDAHEFMQGKVARRLANNLKPARELSAGLQSKYVSHDGGHTWEVAGTMPLDSAKVIELLKFIAKGLVFHHWGILLPENDVAVYGGFLRFATTRRSNVHDLAPGDGQSVSAVDEALLMQRLDNYPLPEPPK